MSPTQLSSAGHREYGAGSRAGTGTPAARQRRGLFGRGTRAFALEVAAVATGGIGVLRSLAPTAGAGRDDSRTGPERRDDDTREPVLLVHGFGASPACWSAVQRALHADGRTVAHFGYSPRGASVDELAEQLTEVVEDLLAATGAPRLHLVGHSMGGVIIAQALTGSRLAGRVDLVVTLGSPFGGSPWAALWPGRSVVRALRPGSALLRSLATAPAPVGVRWLAFTAAFDLIVPGHRALPAGSHAIPITVEGTGHSGMLADPVVIARIVAAVAARDDVPPRGPFLAA
jgi:triacylglycerol lipase